MDPVEKVSSAQLDYMINHIRLDVSLFIEVLVDDLLRVFGRRI